MAKRKAKEKAKADAPATVKAAAFKVGQRVKVLTGDWGNARGTVKAADDEWASVLIDSRAHHVPVQFLVSNLVAL